MSDADVLIVAGRRPRRPDDKELYESASAVFEMLYDRAVGETVGDELTQLLDDLTSPTSPVEVLRRARAVRRYLRDAGRVPR